MSIGNRGAFGAEIVGIFVTQTSRNGQRLRRTAIRGSYDIQRAIGRVKEDFMAKEPDSYIFVNDATDNELRREGF